MTKLLDREYSTRTVYVDGQFYYFWNGELTVDDHIAHKIIGNPLYSNIVIDFDNTPHFRPRLTKKSINWHSVTGYANGYGHSSENMMLALSKQVDVAFKHMNEGVPYPDFVEELKRKEGDFNAPTVTYHVPVHKRSTLGPQIIYTMFETTKTPAYWSPMINQMDLMLVPCNQNVQAFKDSGVNIPIEVVPLGVNPEEYPFFDRSNNSQDSFIFGHFGSLNVRKGTDLAIKAFRLAFPKEEFPNVFLQIKTTSSVKSWKSWDASLADYESDDRIFEEYDTWTQQELYSRMCQWDAFIFPTRGEGFGLPPIEAISSGLPTIVTAWSGTADFCNTKYTWNLGYELKPSYSYPDDLKTDGLWAEPNLDDIISAMRDVYHNRAKGLAKAKEGSKYIRQYWNFDKAATKLIKVIDKHNMW